MRITNDWLAEWREPGTHKLLVKTGRIKYSTGSIHKCDKPGHEQKWASGSCITIRKI